MGEEGQPAGSNVKAPTPEAVRDSLERVLQSPEFTGSERIRKFLRFIVEETLAGRADRIKAYSIAIVVFERDDSFDPLANPVVRIEAGRLRRRLERYYLTAGTGDPVRIDVPKGGYVPTFTFQDRASTELSESAGDEPAAQASLERSPRVLNTQRRVSLSVLAMPLVLMALLSAGAAGWLMFDREKPARPTAAREDVTPAPSTIGSRPAILLAPFENLTGAPDQDYFVRGISLDILANLVQFSELFVIDGSLSLDRQADQDVLELARRLQASYILAGHMRRDGDKIRVNAQLVETATGTTFWSEVFEQPLTVTNVFAIQSVIASSVARTVAQPYGIVFNDVNRRLRREQPSTLGAYDCLLRAYEYRRHFEPQRHATALACLEHAVKAEPDYSDAVAMLALLYLDEHRFGFNSRGQERGSPERALDTAKHAVEQAPDSALAWRALFAAQYARGELDQAFTAGEQVLTLSPNNPEIKAIVGLRLAHAGRWERGLALVEQAIAANPLHPGWYYFPLVLDHYRRDRYAEALNEAERIDMPEFFWTHAFLAMIHGQLGRQEEGARALGRVIELRSDFAARARELVKMEVPDRDTAEKMLDGLRKAGLDVARARDR